MENRDRYEAWIEEYLERVQNPLGRCHDATNEMKTAFPELTVVPGHVETGIWGRRGHVWLTAPDGTIVDPTASQFPAIFEYEPWTPDSLVRLGKCMSCGEEIWGKVPSLHEDHGSKCVCSPECERELTAEFA